MYSKTIYLEKGNIYVTLTTYLYCHFFMMNGIEETQPDDKCYINWFEGGGSVESYRDAEMFAKIPNQFEWWFKQPHEFPQHPPLRDATKKWEEWTNPAPTPFINKPLKVIKDYYKKHLHFNDETNLRGEALVKKYGIDFSKTIGITWRGTDGITDGRIRMPIETYFPFIDDILKDNPDFRIMCTAEELTILDPLLVRYPQAFVIEEFISSPLGSPHNPERLSKVSGFEKGLQPTLMVWLFSKCSHYIKNRSSTGALASWLSDGRIVNLAHEETLSYAKMDSEVEIEGNRYPLNR